LALVSPGIKASEVSSDGLELYMHSSTTIFDF